MSGSFSRIGPLRSVACLSLKACTCNELDIYPLSIFLVLIDFSTYSF